MLLRVALSLRPHTLVALSLRPHTLVEATSVCGLKLVAAAGRSQLKATYASRLRPHTLVAQGRIR
jgi:hypothetical protein